MAATKETLQVGYSGKEEMLWQFFDQRVAETLSQQLLLVP